MYINVVLITLEREKTFDYLYLPKVELTFKNKKYEKMFFKQNELKMYLEFNYIIVQSFPMKNRRNFLPLICKNVLINDKKNGNNFSYTKTSFLSVVMETGTLVNIFLSPKMNKIA